MGNDNYLAFWGCVLCRAGRVLFAPLRWLFALGGWEVVYFWREVEIGCFGSFSYIFAKLITSWKTDANQQIILACTHSKSWFWCKNYAWGQIFGTVEKKHHMEIPSGSGKTMPAGPSASLSHSLGRWSPHRLGEICFVIVSITIQVDLFSTCYEAATSHAFLAKGAQETLGNG